MPISQPPGGTSAMGIEAMQTNRRGFVLSAFVKLKGPGRAFLEAGLRRDLVSRRYTGDGSWQQLTIRFTAADLDAAGVEVRCVLEGDATKRTEAIFDAISLTPGVVVPHWTPKGLADVGGTAFTIDPVFGRETQLVLAPEAGAQTALLPVGRDVELTEDVRVVWRAAGPLALKGLLSLDLQRNGEPLFRQSIHGVPGARSRGDFLMGRLPLSALTSPSLRAGDVLALRLPAPMDGCSVTLTGRVRSI